MKNYNEILESITDSAKSRAFKKAWGLEVAKRLKAAAMRHAERLTASAKERRFMFGNNKIRNDNIKVFGYVPVLAAQPSAQVEEGRLFGAKSRYKAISFYDKKTKSRNNQIFGVYKSKTGFGLSRVARLDTSPFEEVMNSTEFDEIVEASFDAVWAEMED